MGDVVCGATTGCQVGNRAIVTEDNIFSKPSDLTCDQATTVPMAMAVALYTIQKVVVSKSEEHLVFLLHEGNKSPAFAAIPIAKALGHKVICTSSDPTLTVRKTMIKLGSDEVVDANSRFESNDGIDVVIFFHQPSPGALQRSCEALKPHGKILIVCDQLAGHVFLPATTMVSYQREAIAHTILQPGKFKELWLSAKQLLEIAGSLNCLLEIQQQKLQLLEVLRQWNTNLSEKDLPAKDNTDASFWSYPVENVCDR